MKLRNQARAGANGQANPRSEILLELMLQRLRLPRVAVSFESLGSVQGLGKFSGMAE